MIKRYSTEKAREIVRKDTDLIDGICFSCGLPPSWLKAVLMMELPEIDLFDLAADAVVGLNWLRYACTRRFSMDRHTRNPLRKFDSSTGYGQIFAQVAIEAILFAREHGLRDLPGILEEMFPLNPDNLRSVWFRLHRDKTFNLSCSALNLLSAAWEMTGRLDFGSFTEEEKKLIFSRYYSSAKKITEYGERAYRYYLEYEAQPGERL